MLLMDSQYSMAISLLFDGELKAISNENLIFVYKTKLLSDSFNLELSVIEEAFLKVFNKKYYPIAVSNEEWDEIKNNYNKNKDSYVYIKECVEVTQKDIVDNVEESSSISKNEIDELFDTIIEYE